LAFIQHSRLSRTRRGQVDSLLAECFSHVSRREIRECFFAKGIGRVLALEQNSIVGQVELFVRPVEFAGRRITLGGLGGTCVTSTRRNRGLGHALVRKGLNILRQHKCDIACLNANVRQYPRGGLYHTLGFRLMKRDISFQDIHGRTRYDSGELFIPVCSEELYDTVMNSNRRFHLGPGYW
jgi:predicted N-acetyltransferase YhbS